MVVNKPLIRSYFKGVGTFGGGWLNHQLFQQDRSLLQRCDDVVPMSHLSNGQTHHEQLGLRSFNENQKEATFPTPKKGIPFY